MLFDFFCAMYSFHPKESKKSIKMTSANIFFSGSLSGTLRTGQKKLKKYQTSGQKMYFRTCQKKLKKYMMPSSNSLLVTTNSFPLSWFEQSSEQCFQEWCYISIPIISTSPQTILHLTALFAGSILLNNSTLRFILSLAKTMSLLTHSLGLIALKVCSL